MDAVHVPVAATGHGEAGRLSALWRSGWTELPRGVADDAARLAAALCEVPAAAVVVVDDERQLALAQCGNVPRSLPRSWSPALPLLNLLGAPGVVEVADARQDSQWSRHPLLGDTADFRACLAVPLYAPEGWVLGAVMVLDTRARNFTPAQRDGLAMLARLTAGGLEALRMARLVERFGATEPSEHPADALPSEVALVQRLNQEWQRHARRAESLGLICLVPPAGVDRLVVTEAVVGSLRSSDFLATLDDGRLAALLPSTGVNAAMHVAQRIRQALDRDRSSDELRPLHMGLAALIPNRTGQPVQLLQRARHALQRAEQSALGRIETFSGW